ncbi:site-specific DNA-methyltransferase [Mycobacterium sp. PSTR-4-N]|uniref:DNA-methyltransferase n=1 Tax=Mycobacterium sp. PSTR-4-N TaxID=2917745 RepID=UPI001F14E20E|nr:DNA methyltransferase [Mycobacterium sp. PSTR-4-N]MCG7596325.1 site-specific DNA-methyltransferase [Mycobacterium sp. PSTR-4-N]
MPEPYYADDAVTLYHGDCLDVLAELPDASVDAIITDPPYGISFMGKEWDGAAIRAAAQRDREARKSLGPESATRPGRAQPRSKSAYGNEAIIAGPVRGGRDFQDWCEQWASECLRILKPGGHLLSFGGSRTWHRLAAAVEDVGFEMRDSIAWLYGSGFPKSLNLERCKARHDGSGRCVHPAGHRTPCRFARAGEQSDVDHWQGWGTALKPSFEPIVVGRKPLKGTVAANVLAHGTGALNIDACRVQYVSEADRDQTRVPTPIQHNDARGVYMSGTGVGRTGEVFKPADGGRWPTNVVLDGDQADALDRQSGVLKSGANPTRRSSDKFRNAYGDFAGQQECVAHRGADEGGASRFFPVFRYEAKAASSERPSVNGIAHPTVKPLDLMRWLVRLVTPPGGIVLDPFAGSGTTAEACVHEHMRCITIEREADYLPLIVARLSKPMAVGFDFGEALDA